MLSLSSEITMEDVSQIQLSDKAAADDGELLLCIQWCCAGWCTVYMLNNLIMCICSFVYCLLCVVLCFSNLVDWA